MLTGAPLTDVHITLIAGRAHVKHTEGGDFREATYRAVRNGLMRRRAFCSSRITISHSSCRTNASGRAMSDIQRMNGTFEPPQPLLTGSVLTGKAPVVIHAQTTGLRVASYTKGRGRLSCTPGGYEVCHNTEAVVTASGYDAERRHGKIRRTSVFCSHGAGYVISGMKCRSTRIWTPQTVCLRKKETRRRPASVSGTGAAASGFENDSGASGAVRAHHGPVRDRGFEALQQSRKKGGRSNSSM